MVEFALSFPLLLLLAISIADYGYYLEHVNNIATVVRDGARYAGYYANRDPVPLNSACPDPTWLTTGNGGWSCAGLSTTVASGSSAESITSSAFVAGTATIDVASTTGFSTGEDFYVTTTTSTSTGTGTAVIACTGTGSGTFTGCGTDSYTGTSPTLVSGNELEGTSDFTEGVIQEEAESLTVPEGGLPLDNIDCCWAGSSGGSGCPTGGSGSGTTPVLGGTPQIPTSWPTGVSAPTGTSPVSCMTISYWNSSNGSDSNLSLCEWWSSDANSDAGLAEPISSCVFDGEVVQVTVAYDWSQASPGPVFSVLNSVFGIKVVASATYSFAVTN
jgi:hypothetical protein